MAVDAAAWLAVRRSTPPVDLRDPGPDSAQLERLLTLALRVPDHGKLAPWRIQCVRDGARGQLAAGVESAFRSECAGEDPARITKSSSMMRGAPLLLVVSSHLTQGHKVPESEQLLSGGALCYNLLLAAYALGFGACWLTGWPAYSNAVKLMLGIAAHDHILGFVSIGTPARPNTDRPRPSIPDIVSSWAP